MSHDATINNTPTTDHLKKNTSPSKAWIIYHITLLQLAGNN